VNHRTKIRIKIYATVFLDSLCVTSPFSGWTLTARVDTEVLMHAETGMRLEGALGKLDNDGLYHVLVVYLVSC
jgi:hypothetical protein